MNLKFFTTIVSVFIFTFISISSVAQHSDDGGCVLREQDVIFNGLPNLKKNNANLKSASSNSCKRVSVGIACTYDMVEHYGGIEFVEPALTALMNDVTSDYFEGVFQENIQLVLEEVVVPSSVIADPFLHHSEMSVFSFHSIFNTLVADGLFQNSHDNEFTPGQSPEVSVLEQA